MESGLVYCLTQCGAFVEGLALGTEAVRQVRNGSAIAFTDIDADRVRAHGLEGELLALLVRAGDLWKPVKVFDWS